MDEKTASHITELKNSIKDLSYAIEFTIGILRKLETTTDRLAKELESIEN